MPACGVVSRPVIRQMGRRGGERMLHGFFVPSSEPPGRGHASCPPPGDSRKIPPLREKVKKT